MINTTINLFGKESKNEAIPIATGRVSEANINDGTISPYRNKIVNLLQKLRQTYDATDAINLLIKEHPDVSMAFSTLIRLANQGFNMEFYANGSIKGKNKSKFEKQISDEWREFSSRVNGISSQGLDGLIDQFHSSAFAMGGMGCEVVVRADLSDIEDVYPISPQTIEWQIENRNGIQKWIPYQRINGKKIDLSKGNFLWCPFDTDIGRPDGNLMLKSAIPAADMQLEFFNSSQTVLYRIGAPRYDVSISIEKIMESAPVEVKSDSTGKKQQKYIQECINQIQERFRSIGVENDFVHTDDSKIETKGGQSAFFQGIDAYANIIDIQIMNSLKVLGTLMNRRDKGGSYALSSVEFKIMCDTIDSMRRGSKRLVEDIARLWLRVRGYDAVPKFTHNPIDWQTLKDQIEYKLKVQELNRRAQEYGWISADEAAKNGIGAEKAAKAESDLFAYVNSQNIGT